MKYAISNSQIKHNFINEGNPYIKKIEDKIKDHLNNYCVECGEENPEFISINNGIFLCRDCVQNHLNFPKNISKIKKNNIQSLTLNEIQYLLYGGNRALLNFICNEFPKLAEIPSNILYKTQAMIYYRQYLQFLINGRIPPIKPSFNSAYKIPKLYDNISKKNNNIDQTIDKKRIYNTDLFDNNSTFKTEYNFIRNENNDNEQLYTNVDNNRITINNNFNNTIGNKPINYDNYYINRPKQVNFQNNNNIIIGNKMEFIDNMNIKKNNKFLKSSGKMKIKKNNDINEYINTINLNNINNENTDVYIKPKLMLSHNISKSSLMNKNNLKQRESSYDKKYFYSQNNIRPMESKIDSIQLNFSKDIKKNVKMNKNLSYEMYTKPKPKQNIQSKKYLHKSYSQKMFNNNNYSYSYINKNYFDNNNINNKKYAFIYQNDNNNQYIPTKNATINYISNNINNNSNNNICITNNEKFQIISDKKTKVLVNNINKIKKNDNITFINDKSENKDLYNSSIKMNIKVNKKDNNYNIYNEANLEIKKDNLIKDISKKENIKNFIVKCNKKRIIIREKEKNNLINKKNKKDKKEKNKEIDNNKEINNKKRSAFKNSSQEDILKQSDSNQYKINDNKNEKKSSSIRKKYKGKIKHK